MVYSSGATSGLWRPLSDPCPGPTLVGRHVQAREGLTRCTSVPSLPQRAAPHEARPDVLLLHKCLSKPGSAEASWAAFIVMR